MKILLLGLSLLWLISCTTSNSGQVSELENQATPASKPNTVITERVPNMIVSKEDFDYEACLGSGKLLGLSGFSYTKSINQIIEQIGINDSE